MRRWRVVVGVSAAVAAAAGLGSAALVGQEGSAGRPPATAATVAAARPPAPTWYFAISGDSRDCGDLIMPKIAAAIAGRRQVAPVEFYWHLGDFRRLTDVDCDIAKRAQPDYDCERRPPAKLGDGGLSAYLDSAWQDFIDRQIGAFGETPVFLGIGNHELAAGRTRDDVRHAFRRWLTEEPIHHQRGLDARRFASLEGDTYYHFVLRGVDFIELDNADSASFSAAQVTWLASVLAADAADPKVQTIVAAMHEALPYSQERGHAMDASCQGLCSGQQVYDLLYRSQDLGGPPLRRKQVYVFASHAHLFAEDVFKQPEHSGQVLPGWIIGTAGAEQYSPTIRYGYLEVAVHPDGSLEPRFREVTRTSAPATPKGDPLGDFCFERNQRQPAETALHVTCACGAAVP
jgi:hypothetical protein